jgi:hypothetical protein
VNLGEFRTALENELGLDDSSETDVIDRAVNLGVLRVLRDTKPYVKKTTYTGFDGTSYDYTIDSAILLVEGIHFSTDNTPLIRLSPTELLEQQLLNANIAGVSSRYYATAGDNLLMFDAPPSTSDSLVILYVPVPTVLSATGDDPSNVTYGGISTNLHQAIFLWAAAECASYDDDQSSSQGMRYRQQYADEIATYLNQIRQKGGLNARAVARGQRYLLRRRANNSVYP